MLHSIFFIFSCCIFYTTAENLSYIQENAAQYGVTIDPANFPPDVQAQAVMSPAEIARDWGYGAQTHNTTTKDGYILHMHRIYNSSIPLNSNKVVYMLHGILDSASTWVVNSPNESLAFVLADRGYDVWLGNFRGSSYSKEHIKYNPNEAGEFWDFAIDELASIDLPTMLDYILSATNSESVDCVGHSAGTSTILMYLSKPGSNQKIKSAHLFGPILSLNHSSSPMVSAFVQIQDTSDKYTELFNNSDFQRNLSEMTSNGNTSAYQQIFGDSVNQWNETRLPVYFANNPASSSVRQGIQLGQFARSGEMRYFDYGTTENLKKYNQTKPPLYPVAQISGSKINLYYSDCDVISDPKDVEMLIEALGDSVESIHHLTRNESVFNHFDYTWSIRAFELVYKQLITELEKHDTSTSNN